MNMPDNVQELYANTALSALAVKTNRSYIERTKTAAQLCMASNEFLIFKHILKICNEFLNFKKRRFSQ